MNYTWAQLKVEVERLKDNPYIGMKLDDEQTRQLMVSLHPVISNAIYHNVEKAKQSLNTQHVYRLAQGLNEKDFKNVLDLMGITINQLSESLQVKSLR